MQPSLLLKSTRQVTSVNKFLCKIGNLIKENFIAKNGLQTREALSLAMSQKYALKKKRERVVFVIKVSAWVSIGPPMQMRDWLMQVAAY